MFHAYCSQRSGLGLLLGDLKSVRPDQGSIINKSLKHIQTLDRNPSAGTNAVFTLPDLTNPMTAGFDHAGAPYTVAVNFGQQPFTYTPPTGFVALNTYNL